MATIAEQFFEIGRQRGLQWVREHGNDENVQIGMQIGFLRGTKEVLLQLLKRKFNTVPAHYQKFIEEEIDEAQIYKWSEILLNAKTVEEVFEPPTVCYCNCHRKV